MTKIKNICVTRDIIVVTADAAVTGKTLCNGYDEEAR